MIGWLKDFCFPEPLPRRPRQPRPIPVRPNGPRPRAKMRCSIVEGMSACTVKAKAHAQVATGMTRAAVPVVVSTPKVEAGWNVTYRRKGKAAEHAFVPRAKATDRGEVIGYLYRELNITFERILELEEVR